MLVVVSSIVLTTFDVNKNYDFSLHSMELELNYLLKRTIIYRRSVTTVLHTPQYSVICKSTTVTKAINWESQSIVNCPYCISNGTRAHCTNTVRRGDVCGPLINEMTHKAAPSGSVV